MTQTHKNPPASYFKYGVDQLVAFAILSYCVGSICNLFYESFTYEAAKSAQHLPCPRNQNCLGGPKFDDPTIGANPSDGSVAREIDTLALEAGMKDAPSFKHFSVRSFNAFFRLKLVILPLVLAPLQNFPGLCVALLLLYSLGSWVYTIYILCRHRPFNGKIVSLYQVVLETSILIFSLGAFYLYMVRQYGMMSNLDQTASKLDLVITLSVLCSILLQLIRVILELGEVVLGSVCQKKLTRSAMKSAKLQTYFASVYRTLQEQLMAGTQMMKTAPLRTYESHTSFSSARKQTSTTGGGILRTAPHDGNETDRTSLNLRPRNIREKVSLAQEKGNHEFGVLSTRRIRAAPTIRQNPALMIPGHYGMLPPLLLPRTIIQGVMPRLQLIPVDGKPSLPFFPLVPQTSLPKPSPRSLTSALTTRRKPTLQVPTSTSNMSQFKPQRSDTLESVRIPQIPPTPEHSQSVGQTLSIRDPIADVHRGLRIRVLKAQQVQSDELRVAEIRRNPFHSKTEAPKPKPKQYNSMEFFTDTKLEAGTPNKKFVSSDLRRPGEELSSVTTNTTPRSFNLPLRLKSSNLASAANQG